MRSPGPRARSSKGRPLCLRPWPVINILQWYDGIRLDQGRKKTVKANHSFHDLISKKELFFKQNIPFVLGVDALVSAKHGEGRVGPVIGVAPVPGVPGAIVY